MSSEITPFKEQTFTTTEVSRFTGISRREVHDLTSNSSLDLHPQKVPHGGKEKFIFNWDDFLKFSHHAKKGKTINHKVKTVANAKGGVGKTSTATNIICEACYRGNKVLAIDLDPQGQLTYNLGLEDHTGKTFKDIIAPDGRVVKNIQDVVVPLTPLLDIVPASIQLNGLELILKNRMTGSEYVIKEAIAPVLDKYDLIIFDTNPYVSLAFVNAVMAADHIIIPALTDFNSHLGLDYMFAILENLFSSLQQPKISIIPNGYDVRNNISKQSVEEMNQNFSSYMTHTKIRSSTDIPQANKNQQSIRQYKKSSKACLDFSDLAEELLV